MTNNNIYQKNFTSTQKEPTAIYVPIHEKYLLSIREAAEYSNIGINKLTRLLLAPNCEFVLYVGTKKLVKRKKFEEFLQAQVII